MDPNGAVNAEGVTLDMYSDAFHGVGEGLDFGSARTVAELNKALMGASDDGTYATHATYSDGRALVAESLENTLKVLTYNEKMIRLWQDIRKIPAYAFIEEYNTLNSYGADMGAFITEKDMAVDLNPPETNDSDYSRKTARVKFMGTTGVVSHPMTLVRTAHGDPVARETENRTKWLLRQIELKLFEGNSTQISSEFDGLYKQLVDSFGSDTDSEITKVRAARNSMHVIDCRNKPLTEEVIEEAVSICVQNYGAPTDLYLANKAMGDLGKIMYPRERVNTPFPQGGRTGYMIQGINTQNGPVDFKPDVFLNAAQPHRIRYRKDEAAGIGTATKIPRKATQTGLSVAANTGATGGQWDGWYDGYKHYYMISASNRFGESAPIYITSGNGVTVADAAYGVTIRQIAEDTADSGAKTWTNNETVINVYRATLPSSATAPGANDANIPFYKIASFKATDITDGFVDGDSTGTLGTITNGYVDLNESLPGTSMAYMVEHDEQVLSFKQLAPLLKMPLAPISPALRFALLLYGMEVLYAPRKTVVFRNIPGTNNYPG